MSAFKIVKLVDPLVVAILTAGPAISAGTSSQGTGTIVFADSNGVTFGMSDGTITASAAGGGGGVNIKVSAGSVSQIRSDLTFDNSNGITFGLGTGASAGHITASHNGITQQSTQPVALSGSNGSFTFATATFGNLNGLSFYTSNGSIVGSYTVPVQSAQTIGGYAVGNTTGQSSSSTLDARSVSISGAGGVSVGYSGGSVIISGPQTVAQTNQTEGWYGVGNTTGQSSSTTLDARTISLQGAGGVSVGYSAGSVVISGPQTVAQTVQTVGGYALGNTTGESSSSTFDARSFSVRGDGGISVGYSAGSLRISGPQTAAQTNQSLGYYAVGNTTGESSSSTFDARTISINGMGGVSVGYSNGSIIISGNTGGGGGGITAINLSAGTTSTNKSNFTFADGNGITFGLDTGANAGIITATVKTNYLTVQTDQSVGLYGVGNTTQNSSTTLDARTLSFGGRGGITVGFSNGTVQISGPQTVAQTNQTVGMYALGNTTQNSSTTLDARTLSLNGLGGITVGYSNGSIQISGPQTVAQTNQSVGFYAVGNTTQNSSTTLDARTVSFRGNQDITVGYSNGSVQLSVNVTAAQSNQSVGLYAVGNTTQNSSTTLDARTLSFGGRGDITVGYSNGSVQISGSQSNQQMSAFAASNTTQSSSGTFNASSIIFAGAGIASVGVTNGSVVISVPSGGGAGDGGVFAGVSTMGNTAGSTGTVSTGNFILVGTGGISLSQSTGAAGSAATVTISAPNSSSLVGASGMSISTNGSTISVQPTPMSQWNKANAGEVSIAAAAQANSLVSIVPFRLDWPVAFSNVRLAASINVATQTNNSSAYIDLSISGVVYTRNASTLSSLYSFSNTMTQTYSSNNTGSATGIAAITATHAGTTLTPGDYWMAVHISTNNTATGGAATTALGKTLSMILAESIASANLNLKPWGSTVANSNGLMSGMGIISTGATRASIAFSDYTVSGSRGAQANLYFGLRNETYQV